jgi:cell division protein FtsW (lipid II flippase)
MLIMGHSNVMIIVVLLVVILLVLIIVVFNSVTKADQWLSLWTTLS